MDIQITNAEAGDGQQQHGADGQTRWIKTLPATNPAFQAALAHTCHTVSWNSLYLVRHTNSSQDQQQRVVALAASNVEYFSGKLYYQLKTYRPSYVNAVLIQTRGAVNANQCSLYSMLICRTIANDRVQPNAATIPTAGRSWSASPCRTTGLSAAATASFEIGHRNAPTTTDTTGGGGLPAANNPPAAPAAPVGLPPVVHTVTDMPYEIEEPDDEEEDAPGVVRRQITDGR